MSARVDAVVSDAELFGVAGFAEEPLEHWRRVLSVNLDRALVMTEAAYRGAW